MHASMPNVTHKRVVDKLKYEHKNIQLKALIERELGAAVFNVKAEILRLVKKINPALQVRTDTKQPLISKIFYQPLLCGSKE
jgi:hypothetical protein